VGQNGGPLPFEAIIVSGKSIMESWKKITLAKENQDGGASNLVFRFRGTSKSNGWTDERASVGWVTVAREQRRERSKHQLTEVLRPSRAARLAERLEQRRGALIQTDGRTTFGWISVSRDRRRERSKHQPTTVLRPSRAARLAEGLEKRRGASMRRENGVKPVQVLRLRAARLGAGEAPVEMEGTKVTRPVGEPMTATAIAQPGTICSDTEPNEVLRFQAARLSEGEEPPTAGTRREDYARGPPSPLATAWEQYWARVTKPPGTSTSTQEFGPQSTCWRCTATAETEPEETSLSTNVAWSGPPTEDL